MAPPLIACPHCGCHAKSTETECPTCGERLRRRDGTLPRTAAAMIMGLTATIPLVMNTAGCSSETSSAATGTGGSGGEAAAYGIAVTTGGGNGGNGGKGGAGGAGSGGMGGVAPAYGIGMTTGGGTDAGTD